jgi:hypothetical protein
VSRFELPLDAACGRLVGLYNGKVVHLSDTSSVLNDANGGLGTVVTKKSSSGSSREAEWPRENPPL